MIRLPFAYRSDPPSLTDAEERLINALAAIPPAKLALVHQMALVMVGHGRPKGAVTLEAGWGDEVYFALHDLIAELQAESGITPEPGDGVLAFFKKGET
jgi:hypothetical protein